MPIYEYRCGECGHELEALQKISDPKLTTCPECGKETLSKLVSAAAFVLKGSGWYATDFRDKGGNQQNSNQSTGTSNNDDSSKSGKDDSKPAAGGGDSKGDNQKPEKSDSKSSQSAKQAAGDGD